LEKFGGENDKQPHQLHGLKNNLMSNQLAQLVLALFPVWQVQTSGGRFFEFLKKLWFEFFKYFRIKEPSVLVI
jgi:hypothetical protein